MNMAFRNRCWIVPLAFALWCALALAAPGVRGGTSVSGQVLTSDGKVVASGVVALETGELHNSAFLVGGEIGPDGTFEIPLPSGGPWGLHVYSEGYLYFPLQIHVSEGEQNEIPVILPLDSEPGDDPRITNITFSKASESAFRVRMRVEDADRNLGPQMLAIDRKRLKAYRMLPATGDLKDKTADFPEGEYVSPLIPHALERENLEDWLFTVADHKCSNGPIYDGRNTSVFQPPVPHKESFRCEAAGIWKSNFGKIFSFTESAPGTFAGEQFEGQVIIDKMVQKAATVHIDFRFQEEKGKAALKLWCEGNDVTLRGTYTRPEASGEWVFTKLKNSAEPPSGRGLFMTNCSVCHYHDRTEVKTGPGLKGLFHNPRLPASGRPTDAATVWNQITRGGIKMPPFRHLKKEEVSAIIDYLKTL
jgi:hypothetical protein